MNIDDLDQRYNKFMEYMDRKGNECAQTAIGGIDATIPDGEKQARATRVNDKMKEYFVNFDYSVKVKGNQMTKEEVINQMSDTIPAFCDSLTRIANKETSGGNTGGNPQ